MHKDAYGNSTMSDVRLRGTIGSMRPRGGENESWSGTSSTSRCEQANKRVCGYRRLFVGTKNTVFIRSSPKICDCLISFLWFHGISYTVGYLMPNPFLYCYGDISCHTPKMDSSNLNIFSEISSLGGDSFWFLTRHLTDGLQAKHGLYFLCMTSFFC